MRTTLIASAILSLALAGFEIGYVQAHGPSDASQLSAGAGADVPAFHAEPPTGPLPATLDPAQFHDALTKNVYALAAKEKAVLYQQPCYCRCDRHVGHKSLLDCFGDKHGATCDVCKKEAVYSYEQTQQGKAPAEIREAIIEGKWKSVDLSKYATSAASK